MSEFAVVEDTNERAAFIGGGQSTSFPPFVFHASCMILLVNDCPKIRRKTVDLLSIVLSVYYSTDCLCWTQ